MRKILIVSGYYAPYTMGAGDISTRHLAKALVRLGHNVRVLTCADDVSKSYINGVAVERIRLPNIYWRFGPQRSLALKAIWHVWENINPRTTRAVGKKIDEFAPDVILTSVVDNFRASIWATARRHNIPLLNILRSYYAECWRSSRFKNGENCQSICFDCKLGSIGKRIFSNRVDGVGISSAILRDHFREGYFLGIPDRVIFNSIDYKAPAPRRGLRFSEPTFGFIGSLQPSKGFEEAIRAFGELALRLKVAGTGDPQFVEILKAGSNSTKIEFLGYTKPKELFPKLDFLIFPSLWNEPFGRGIAEAMGYGIPVIGTTRGGIPELIEHGKNGFLCNPDDPNGLVTAIREATNSYYQSLSRQALYSAERFAGDSIAKQYLIFMEKLIAENRTRKSAGFSKLRAEAFKQYVKKVLRPFYYFARRNFAHHLLKRAHLTKIPHKSFVPVVFGLLSSTSGLGKSARLCISSLSQSFSEVGAEDLSKDFGQFDGQRYDGTGTDVRRDNPKCYVSILHLNPPMMTPFLLSKRGIGLQNDFKIGYWAWELESVPNEWIKASRALSAILVPSNFVRKALQENVDVPVFVVPHPVTPPQKPNNIRGLLSCSEHDILFCSVFNFGSSFERKNPIATVQAFNAAFPNTLNVKLILKTTFGSKYPTDLQRLWREIGNSRNIIVIDEVWPDSKLADLMNSIDILVSLHRSEGFGLTIAEAMSIAKPVIVTNWSGNTDYCHSTCAAIVDFKLVEVKDKHPDYRYVSNARWAEPDIGHAAQWMRDLYTNPDLRANLGKSGLANLRMLLATNSYSNALAQLT